MKVEAMRDEARLCFKERRDWADNLETSIARGLVKRPESDVALIRSRLPEKRAIAHAFMLIIQWRDRLPREFLDQLEAEL